jgi:hypothetical protein
MSTSEGLSPQIIETDKVTICTSLSTGTSPTTERITLVKSRNKSKKCEHQRRVEDSNSGGQVPPQRTLPAELLLVRSRPVHLMGEQKERWIFA